MAKTDPDQIAEKQSLLERVASSFNDPYSFPDLTVILGDQEWDCHRMILAGRSRWFFGACSKIREARGSHEIKLHKDDPIALAAALEYCYTFKIDYEGHSYSGPLFYAQVVTVAEKYEIKGLAALAADGFREAINSDEMSAEELVAACKEVYSTNSQITRELRGLILRKTLDNAEIFHGGDSDFFRGGDSRCYSRLIQDVPMFAADMVEALVKDRSKKRKRDVETRYRCPKVKCSKTFTSSQIKESPVDCELRFYCGDCSAVYIKKHSAWKKHAIEE